MEIDDVDFEVIKLAVENGISDPVFWHSRTPDERLIAIELMRRKKYGYDENSMPRLKRVIEFIDLSGYKKKPAADLPPE